MPLNSDKLNLGSGKNPLIDAVNVDVRRCEGVDIMLDMRDLAFQPERFSHVIAHD